MSSGVYHKNAQLLHNMSKLDQQRYPDAIPYSPLMTESFRRSIKKIDQAFSDMFGSLPAPNADIWIEREVRAFYDFSSEDESDSPSFDGGDDDVDPVLERTFNSFSLAPTRKAPLDVLVGVLPPRSSKTSPFVFLSRQPTIGKGSAATPFVPQQPMVTPPRLGRAIHQPMSMHRPLQERQMFETSGCTPALDRWSLDRSLPSTPKQIPRPPDIQIPPPPIKRRVFIAARHEDAQALRRVNEPPLKTPSKESRETVLNLLCALATEPPEQTKKQRINEQMSYPG
jgi:hypothetical protein